MDKEQYEAYKNSVKIIYESNLQNESGQPYLKMLEATTAKGGKYVYSQRAGIDSIKFILIDRNHKLFGLVQELKPPIMDLEYNQAYNISAFGGSMDLEVKKVSGSYQKVNLVRESNISLVAREVLEETGYYVTPERIVYKFSKLLGSQSDEIVHGYVIDVTNLTPANRKLEDGEESSSVVWLSTEDVIKYGCLSAITLALMA